MNCQSEEATNKELHATLFKEFDPDNIIQKLLIPHAASFDGHPVEFYLGCLYE